MPAEQTNKKKSFIQTLFLNDKLILAFIIINSITIFIEGFSALEYHIIYAINFIDSFITVMFMIEAAVKIRYLGWRNYIQSAWNKLDFFLIVISLPSILVFLLHSDYTNLSFLLILRVLRVFKFLRFFRFITGIEHLLIGIQRALKTSVFVLFGFLIYHFIVAVLSCFLFSQMSDELFGDPLRSFYSIFKIFTVEGWYEIPETLTENQDGVSSFFIKTYFILILITGGILGLSLVNSIFVDSMVSDNNDELEEKVDELNLKIDRLIQELNQKGQRP